MYIHRVHQVSSQADSPRNRSRQSLGRIHVHFVSAVPTTGNRVPSKEDQRCFVYHFSVYLSIQILGKPRDAHYNLRCNSNEEEPNKYG